MEPGLVNLADAGASGLRRCQNLRRGQRRLQNDRHGGHSQVPRHIRQEFARENMQILLGQAY